MSSWRDELTEAERAALTEEDLDRIDRLPQSRIEPVDEALRDYFAEVGAGQYVFICRLDGKLVALGAFLFTVGIVVGLDESGYEVRYCYESAEKAFSALVDWGLGEAEEPAGYIKRK